MPRALPASLVAALLGLSVPPDSPPNQTSDVQAGHASASLLLAAPTVAPGQQVDLGIRFTISQGWHLYWNGRNDTGTAPQVKLTLPDGVKAGEILWPAPVRHVSPGEILDHIYEREFTLIVPLDIQRPTPGAALKIRARLDWVACKDVCLFEGQEVSLDIPLTAAATPGAEAQTLRAIRAMVPVPWPKENPPASITWASDAVEILAPRAESVQFFPASDCAELAHPIADTSAKGHRLRIRLVPAQDRFLIGIVAITESKPSSTAYYSVHMAENP